MYNARINEKTMSKTAVILKHTHNQGSCYLGKILEEQDFDVKSLGVPHMDFNAFDPLEHDLMMIMGAPIGIYQAEDYPFVYEEQKMLRKRIEADKPTLGVCFGAQLIASTLGADIYPGDKGKEIGWNPVTMTENAKDHPLRHLDASRTNMFHWHGDTFDMPEGATLLATSDKYKQAFSYGNNILAVQFHTEMRRQRLEEWYVTQVRDLIGPDTVVPIKKLKKQSAEYMDTLNAQTEKFLTEWLEKVKLL